MIVLPSNAIRHDTAHPRASALSTPICQSGRRCDACTDMQVDLLYSAVNAHYAMMISRIHTGSPDVLDLPQRDEALMPEAPMSMPDDQELDTEHQAHKDKPAHRRGRS